MVALKFLGLFPPIVILSALSAAAPPKYDMTDPDNWDFSHGGIPANGITCETQALDPSDSSKMVAPQLKDYGYGNVHDAITKGLYNYGPTQLIPPIEDDWEHYELHWKAAGWDHKSIVLKWTVNKNSNLVSWNGAFAEGIVRTSGK